MLQTLSVCLEVKVQYFEKREEDDYTRTSITTTISAVRGFFAIDQVFGVGRFVAVGR
jgi:hypothetical protein